MKNDAFGRKQRINKLMFRLQCNLRQLRHKNKLSQAQLAAKLNVDQSTISNFESGRSVMTIEHVYELYLMFGDDFSCPNILFSEQSKTNNKNECLQQ
ncbi:MULTISPECIES: helix-turn-helix transcriptional regulator [unclassified Pseudoalteromonas]|uniref:helix-turn-helix domain-containing protein n=1 Tax=unclassified Pseudoalteromonas TaxID=194690 RepID=UPI002096EEDC|nr:helix-turn-helix transcriptional regulator [Pseudoalteromonas sp. XMcav2-N]MCO7189028.1 helix-turn-helix domain-containing protein [Pseudoalteromonas sp. XMcav2-N]